VIQYMNLSRFATSASATPSLGVVDDHQETVRTVDTASTSLDEALRNSETWETLLRDADGDTHSLADVFLCSPVERPANLIGVGLDYAGHAEEGGHDVPDEPVFFAKSPSSITGPGTDIVRHEGVTNLHWEGKFGFVVGETARNLDESAALDAVFGYVAGNDVTARDLQGADLNAGRPWFRSKSMDTFTPLGPWVTPTDQELNPGDADVETAVNGDVVQSSNTSDLIFSVPELVAAVSRYVTLQPGDVVLTGTPAGVGEVGPGDRVSVTVEGVGTLTNTVTER
jgi:2-keto-4-pentenoate hydratase/2-oxohepta-3-ene-1,7-dioic acid hydratase in catechol pathway